MQPDRRVRDTAFLGDYVALEKAALAPAVALRPRHADPAALAHPAAESRAVAGFAVRCARIERASGNLLLEEGTHLRSQRLHLGREPDLVEADRRAHALARREHRPERVGA